MTKISLKEQTVMDMSYDLIKILLTDKTTGNYIVWATNNYINYGENYFPEREITPNIIMDKNKNVIRPRVLKREFEKIKRTKHKAEVFTPSWVCNIQNNLIDDAWFGVKNVFNKSFENGWVTNLNKIKFEEDKSWKEYVSNVRLEISCGEAPYLVSRYDTVTGEKINILNRIGIIDRKLRVINENTDDNKEWFKWVIKAFQSTYGYDYQGDNVFLARENLLLTFIDYYEKRFGYKPSLTETKKVAKIISWNIWQMDGITMSTPHSNYNLAYKQTSLFDFTEDKNDMELIEIPCKIFDWKENLIVEFKSLINRR